MIFPGSQWGAEKLDIIIAVIIIMMTFGQRAGKGFYNKVLMRLNKVQRTQRNGPLPEAFCQWAWIGSGASFSLTSLVSFGGGGYQ